jgi:site-specific DNA recombinase
VTTTAAAIYCRISNDADGRMLGVTRQERSCRRLAAQRGLHVAQVFIDNDISAFSGARRPAYQQLLAGLAEGAFAAVLAWDGDRLHRSTRELEDFLDVIETTGAIVVTVTAGEIDLVTATGRMQARIKGDISRYESEHKTERTAAAHAYLAEAGRWKGGPRPYGYDVGRDNHGRPLRDGRLVMIPAEAAIVTEAAARVLAGESTYAICNDLNDRHIPTARNGTWRTQTLRRILTNPTTAAKRDYHGQIVADALWPPLLTEEVWLQLRDRLSRHGPDQRHRREPGAPSPRRFLLTGGIAVCGSCGTNLHAHTRQNGKRAYNCVGGPDKGGCGGVTCSARALDQHVIAAVLASYTQADTPTNVADGTPLGPIPARPSPLEQGIAELAQLFANGQLSPPAWRVARAGIAAVEAGTSALQHQESEPDPALIEQWRAMPLNRQRERITDALAHVIVNPTQQRGPNFDRSRIELLWHTDATP